MALEAGIAVLRLPLLVKLPLLDRIYIGRGKRHTWGC